MQNPKRLLLSAALALTLSAFSLQVFSLSSPAATAPVSVPASATLNLTDPNRPTLFMTGYSHLDTQWRWSYPLVIREFLPKTFNGNLKLIEKFPHYTFNWTGAGRYKLIKDYYPADFEKIRAAVAAGRWFPNGVAWEENDANIPSAESQIRQFLLGREFFLKEFGTESNEFMLPDCFGFPAALPSILHHCGIRGFSTQKLTWGSAVGIPFNVGEWVGTDGHSVIAALNAGVYLRPIKENPGADPKWLERIQKNGGKSGIYADFTYMGAGDTGGAPKPESVANMEQGASNPDSPVRVICARADLMFNSISDEQMKGLPKYTGDLLLIAHSAGCLTSQSYMKRWNRANELLADAAERASVAAWLLGAAPYPREKLNAAWQLVLRSQMHDILPGTSLPKAYEYSWNDEVLCLNTFAEILTAAVGAVASGMDTRPADVAQTAKSADEAQPRPTAPLVVYNPLSIAREDVVEATVNLPGAKYIQVLDGAGNPVPTQLLSRDGDTCRIAFLAKAPSVGFAVYTVTGASSSQAREQDAPPTLKVTPRTLENPRYRVTLNDAGDIASILDKQQNRELLASPARLAFLNESPKNTPAWDMDWSDRKNPPRAYVGDTGKPRIEIIENGPVRVALRITRDAEGSTFEQTIRLAAGALGSAADRIEISNTIDWRSKGCSLKAEFPLTVSNPLATYNQDLGKIQRANNDPKKYEVPTHQWFDLTDTTGASGVTILTAAKYGTDKPADNTLRLTLLYSPHVDSKKGLQEQRWQDWGRHDFTYGIYAHAGGWAKGRSDWQALRMEQPLLAFTTTEHDGKLGRTYSLLQLDTDAVAIRAIKLAENSDRIIIRLQELNGAQQPGARLTTPAADIAALSEVNGVEKILREIKGANGSTLAFDFSKYQLRAFALAPAAPPAKLIPAATAPVTLPYNVNAFGYRSANNNGDFDGAGATIPAEMISDTIMAEGIPFKLGPRAKAGKPPLNAVRCEGQTIALPAGNFNRIYLLAAAVSGDTSGKFTVGDSGAATTLKVQNWTGYIGSWDNRVFKGDVPEDKRNITNPLARIDTGFIKRDPVAWFCDHHYTKGGKDAIYSYCYLFKYSLPIPAGAKTITLPNNPKIRILAMTAALDPAAGTHPAQPLYDDFTDRKPIVIPAGWEAVPPPAPPRPAKADTKAKRAAKSPAPAPAPEPAPAPVASPDPDAPKGFREVFKSDDGVYQFTIDTTQAPEMNDWARAKMVPIVKEWYPKLVKMLPSKGYEAPKSFTILCKPLKQGGAPAMAGNREITCNSNWFMKNLRGEAGGAVVHEMVHLVQRYGEARRNNPNATRNPGWLVEGIADYIRWFLYEPQKNGAHIGPNRADKVNYDGSYRTTANFINWVSLKYDKEIAFKLNAACRQGLYTEDLWKKYTGRTVQELNAEWKAHLASQPPK